MENASNALLMAAGVLIGIIILSLAVYLFVSFSNSTTDMQNQMEDAAITNFNNQYLAYDGKENLTIYDVFTLVNLARENNEKYELTGKGIEKGSFYIAVYLDTADTSTKGKEADTSFEVSKVNIENYMKTYTANGRNNKKLKRYTCEVKINETTSLVNKIIFKENKNYDYNT